MRNIFYPALTWRLSISGLPYRTRIPRVRSGVPARNKPYYRLITTIHFVSSCKFLVIESPCRRTRRPVQEARPGGPMSALEGAAHGRFAPGQNDDAAGRRHGSRNSSTLAIDADQAEPGFHCREQEL